MGDLSVRYFEYGYKEYGSLEAPRYFRAQGSGSATTSFRVPGLKSNTQYQIYIRAVNSRGPGTALVVNKQTIADPDTTVAPLAPANLRAIPGDGEVRLTWDNPRNIVIKSYEYSIDNAPWRRIQSATNATFEVELGGLVNGVEYEFRLRALTNVAGPHTTTTGIPNGQPFDSTVKTRILGEVIIIDENGLHLDVSDRVLEARFTHGRTRGTDSFDGGYARITIDTSDDFLTEGGGGRYQPRQFYGRSMYVNGLLYDDNNAIHRRTFFGGFINEIGGWAAHAERSSVQIEAVSLFEKLTLAKITFDGRNSDRRLPGEYTGARIRRILNLVAGIDADDYEIDNGTVRCLPQSTSPGGTTTDIRGNTSTTAATVVEGNALALCDQVAHTEGGRFYIEQGRNFGIGRIRFEQRGPNPPLHLNISSPPVEGHAQPRPRVTTEDDASALYTRIEFTSLETRGGSRTTTEDVRGRITTSGTAGTRQVAVAENTEASRTYGRKTLSRQLLSSLRDSQIIARWYLDVFSSPRYHADSVPLKPHHEDPDVALKIIEATIGDVVRLSYIPPPYDENRVVVSTQRIDGVEGLITPISGKSEVMIDVKFSLLTPEATAYWVLNEIGAAELGDKTRLAPPIEEDEGLATLDPAGNIVWQNFRPDAPQDRSTVTAARFASYLANQSIPVYTDAAQRDAIEAAPKNGAKVAIIGESGDRPTRKMEIWGYSARDTQWLKEAELSMEDANPTIGTFQLDVSPFNQLDAGHTLL